MRRASNSPRELISFPLSHCGAGRVIYVCYAKLLTGCWAACGATLLSGLRGKSTGAGSMPPTATSAQQLRKSPRLAEKEQSSKGNGKKGEEGRGAAERSLRLLWAQPALLALLLGIAATEGFYMGCWFAALTRVSKVYCVAIKKGGNLLFSSIGGWVLFNEKSEGRVLPVFGVVAGVALMSV